MNIWIKQNGSDLAQGDLLPECAVAMVGADFRPILGELTIVTEVRDLIVITQSCDLANSKAQFAALCPIHRLDDFEKASPEFKKGGRWELVLAAPRSTARAPLISPSPSFFRPPPFCPADGRRTAGAMPCARTIDQACRALPASAPAGAYLRINSHPRTARLCVLVGGPQPAQEVRVDLQGVTE